MEIVFGWLVLSLLAGAIASGKGRSFAGFFFLSIFLSPLVGLIAALAASRNQLVLEAKQLAEGKGKKCPFCAEVVRPDAVVCRFCGRELVLETAASR